MEKVLAERAKRAHALRDLTMEHLEEQLARGFEGLIDVARAASGLLSVRLVRTAEGLDA